jgi:hypothetical protein
MAKDFTETELYMDPISDEHCVIMVDVDYYTSMPRWLKYGRPMLLYTFVPEDAAGTHSDGSWELCGGQYRDLAGCASHNGTVLRCNITGGASYTHPIWDYNHDTINAIDWFGNCITYFVEQRSCPSGRRIVGLFPASSVAFPYWLRTPLEHLRRFDCMVGNIPVVDRCDGTLSLGCPGTYEALCVRKIDYLGWVEKSVAVKLKHVVDVEKWMSVSENDKTRNARIPWAPIVFALLQRKWVPSGAGVLSRTGSVKFVIGSRPDNYVCFHPSAPADTITGHETGIAFAPPLVTIPLPFPAKTMANAATAHEVRVRLTQQKFAKHEFKPELRTYAAEFVRLVVGSHKGTVVPIDIGQLAERWTRATQQDTIQRLHTQVQPTPDGHTMRGFLKVEAGVKPRQIVNCDGDHNASLGCYTLAIMDHLKEHHEWIGCGRSPKEIERRVHAVATGLSVPFDLKERLFPNRKLTTAHEGDITNCDGSEKRWHRDHVVDPILMALLSPMYRPVLRKLLKQEEAGFRVKMAEGYAYEAQWELISGTSATTLKNIIKVSFGDYVALRRIGLTPIQAFGCLGIYCGDDSVSVALPFPGLADARVLALADLAMEQKLIVREAPSPVSFLGEFHYGAFFEGGRRLPDFWRQVQKCHLSASNVPVDVAAANRAKGALSSSIASDPLLGPWFTAVANLSGEVDTRLMSREELWKLGQDDTALSERLALRADIVDDWCLHTGVERGELDMILVQIDLAKSLDELPMGLLDNFAFAKKMLPGAADASGTVVPPTPDPSENGKEPQAKSGPAAPRAHQATRPRQAHASAPQNRQDSRPVRDSRGRGTRSVQPRGRGRPSA